MVIDLLKGLKSKITVILVVIVLSSMFSVYWLMSFFWQRSLIETESIRVSNIVAEWIELHDSNKLCGDGGNRKIVELRSELNNYTADIGCYNEVQLNEINLSETTICEGLSRGFYRRVSNVEFKKFFLQWQDLQLVIPFDTEENELLFIYVIQKLDSALKPLTNTQTIILFYILLNTIFFCTLGFFRIAKHIFRPIDDLITISESYSDLDALRFSYDFSKNEFGKLSFALNRMVKKIASDKKELKNKVDLLELTNKKIVDSQNKMIRAENLVVVGRISAGIAHEIGNPLTIIQGYMELLKDSHLHGKDRRVYIERVDCELERIDKMIRKLLDPTRIKASDRGGVSVGEVCRNVLSVMRSQNNTKNIRFVDEISMEHDNVSLNHDELYQVMINCLFNAIDAIIDCDDGREGVVLVQSMIETKNSNGKNIIISIQDNGKGILDTNIEAIFDPFFTTKGLGKGTGLGLSVSLAILQSAGGLIEINSMYKKGTEVSISLPTIKDVKQL